MGKIIRYTHKKCGFEFDFREGVGFHLFSINCEAREHMKNGDWGEYWKKLIEQYPNGTAKLRNALCYCERCREYYIGPCVNFYVPKEGYNYPYEDEDSVPTYMLDEYFCLLEKEVMVCEKCNEEAIVMEDMAPIACPVCGKMRKGRDVGNWD